jgi:cytochrome P450
VLDLFGLTGDSLHRALRAAAEAGPVAIDSTSGATVVLRHADVEALARDHRLAGVGLSLFDLMGITDGPLRDWYGGLMFTNDGPVHDRLRSLVSRAFTPRAVENLRTDAAALADGIAADIVAAGEGDLVDAYALLAMRVMCRLLGVPDEDVAVFGSWADALSPIFGFMDAAQVEAATAAITQLLDYVDDLATRRRSTPASDLITALLAAEDAGDRLSHDELVAMVANLLVGGHDTTTSQIGCSLFALLRRPQAMEQLRRAPELLSSAVNETIRLEPSITGVPRTALEPLTVGGADVAAGGLVMLSSGAANREPGTWTSPDDFVITRFAEPDAPRLLSFGAGPHYCLGAALARVTVEEAVRSVVAIPSVALAEDPDSIPWRVVLGRSPARLPVRV